MKLYATITSERATKGQGGNEYLDIVIKSKLGKKDTPYLIATLQVIPVPTVNSETIRLFIKRKDCWEWIATEEMKETKAKRQKGESTCENGTCKEWTGY